MYMEECRELPTREQIARRSYIRGAIELLGGIVLIGTGIAINDSEATPLLMSGGIVSVTLGYADLSHPIG